MILKPNEIIAKDHEILGGTPVFRGTRVPVQALLDYLEGGQTLDEFLDDFPTVTRETRRRRAGTRQLAPRLPIGMRISIFNRAQRTLRPVRLT